ncbi:hypothetical protein EVAR_27299_1 [Eumeta japonica]|uniref:Uncharacterized protein n=1 Tax=Eumeta variegata TaxID=151549 RepID=A0A4C1UDQ0_EUMVA|nr:hypothetical protein EVAR_27299_1 [Eumeta japonica]
MSFYGDGRRQRQCCAAHDRDLQKNDLPADLGKLSKRHNPHFNATYQVRAHINIYVNTVRKSTRLSSQLNTSTHKFATAISWAFISGKESPGALNKLYSQSKQSSIT